MVWTLQCFQKNFNIFLLLKTWKNYPQNLLIIGPDPFFSVLPISPNPAQISIPVPLKSPTAGLLYNDFVGHTKSLLYAHHYNLCFVYFLLTFWSPKTFSQGAYFLKFWPYVWLSIQERVMMARVQYIDVAQRTNLYGTEYEAWANFGLVVTNFYLVVVYN